MNRTLHKQAIQRKPRMFRNKNPYDRRWGEVWIIEYAHRPSGAIRFYHCMRDELFAVARMLWLKYYV